MEEVGREEGRVGLTSQGSDPWADSCCLWGFGGLVNSPERLVTDGGHSQAVALVPHMCLAPFQPLCYTVMYSESSRHKNCEPNNLFPMQKHSWIPLEHQME